ncbi:siderophore-interacting protein [Corynebacterium lizhenjunii]|uniref:Siderophore-interacting protein n=1 Tax=Corynebacterium lizhenjunii TaxID=2709394 RepID=A0A7T0KEB2_9CORY|nr:siderophore-interacting protein [Corynebacterium lizhenjunii]QPK79220.1 siderophore-interacting protein [Corynebacterium lizhenjunii]
MPIPARVPRLLPVGVRRLQVAQLADVTPTIRRITLTGPQLQAFKDAGGNHVPAFTSENFDDDIRLLFPYPGEREPVLPVIKDGRVSFAPGRRPIARAYTVRRFDAAAGELDVDIILHGEAFGTANAEGGSNSEGASSANVSSSTKDLEDTGTANGAGGFAAAWARTVAVGDAMTVVGPGKTAPLPAEARRVLLLGDCTAIPAIARLLEELPADRQGTALISVPSRDYVFELARPAGFCVKWVVEANNTAGPHDAQAQFLHHLDAVPELAGPDGPCDDPSPDLFVWLAGEASLVQQTRRRLINHHGVARQAISFSGYWRRGHCGTPAPEPADS